MRRFLLILFLLCSISVDAQQLTFRDILAAEPEVKQSTPKKVHTTQDKKTKTVYSYSPLRYLNRTFFESYFSVLGNVGSLSYREYDLYGYSYDARRMSYGIGLEYELGARLDQMFFVGAGVGARTYFPENKNNYGNIPSWGFNMPLYGSVKMYMLADYDFSLCADFGFGGCVTIQKSPMTPHGLYLKIGLGADIKRFTISAGYEMIAKISSGSMGHYGYLKLGVIISK